MYFQEREQPYSQLQRNEGPNPDKRPMHRAWLGYGRVWETMGDKAAGAQGQVKSLRSLNKESRLQCMDSGEQLKTCKQGNTMIHLALLINYSGSCVGWVIGFQDRWLETVTQIRDGKGAIQSSRDGVDGRNIC